jgi:CheY-like chemotaxis protein
LAWSCNAQNTDASTYDAPASSPSALIDNDPSVLELVCELLKSSGLVCGTAADGASGLARFNEGGWDLVLTDVVMPQISGWEVVEAIR